MRGPLVDVKWQSRAPEGTVTAQARNACRETGTKGVMLAVVESHGGPQRCLGGGICCTSVR